MGFLVDALDQQRFDIQRDVVKNERRQSYENRPYGMASWHIQEALFPAPHPYHWMTIGSPADLDAASLDGTPVVWEQFGGLEKFLELLDYCAAWVKTWSGNNDVPDAPIDWASRIDSGFSPRVPPGPDPISGFVSNRCHVDPDAKVPASSLYQAYSEWSWEMGRQAKGQRSFGMGLTKMGFQRRRRGQGYHWWIGLGLNSEERTGV